MIKDILQQLWPLNYFLQSVVRTVIFRTICDDSCITSGSGLPLDNKRFAEHYQISNKSFVYLIIVFGTHYMAQRMLFISLLSATQDAHGSKKHSTNKLVFHFRWLLIGNPLSKHDEYTQTLVIFIVSQAIIQYSSQVHLHALSPRCAQARLCTHCGNLLHEDKSALFWRYLILWTIFKYLSYFCTSYRLRQIWNVSIAPYIWLQNWFRLK